MPRLAPFASSITQRKALLNGASGAALATMLVIAPPAHAQLRNMAAALGHPVSIATPNVQSIGSRSVISPSMAQIQQRQAAYRARISQQANIISSANAAARAAAQAAAQTVPNGMTQGGLVPVANATTSSLDASGLKVWQGASAPTQTTNGNFVDVTINQTQSRALLSWESFNVGRDTTLTFNQQGHSDWVVVNRVVGGINPATGLLDPKLAPSPSQILGSIKADGTVYVLNRSGVLFGATSQVNLHSLVASTLELGASTIPTGSTVTPTRTLSLAERNDAYLQNGILSASRSGLLGSVTGETHGAVTVAQGAQINSTGGFVILAAPTVSSAGEIKTAAGGQASLEAGNQIDAYSSTGAAGSIDPNVRGLVLTSVGGGTVDVSGSIDAPQGYISLGTDQTGAIDFSGVLTSTTSVSRNGKISLTGGTVNARPNAAISILPDSSSATIPISPNSVAAFKTSQIDIGSHFYRLVEGKIVGNSGEADTVNDLLPSSISIGTNATIQAPSADVNIGGTAKGRSYAQEEGLITTSKVDIASGAVIDVSGITDWLLTASRNQLVIDPAKRNELRDTPTYREATTDGSFTLNGQTLYVDPRISGVRSDGVAWIGSPLLEAGSLAEQIGVTASELMTKGGNVTLSTLTNLSQPVSRSSISGVNIAKDATVDFAGGWVRYQDGFIRTSKLITKDGRVVDISAANPNDTYVAVANGFVENLPQLSNPRVYANIFSNDSHFEAGYVEGHDAGSLTIKAPSVHIDPGAQLHGEAVAGLHQIADAQAASAASRVAGDIRKLQARGTELPSSGLLHIQSVLGGDIQVGGARRADPETNYLSASLINRTHLSGLSLQTSGKVTFAGNSTGLTDGEITLADGGALNIDSGRSITFNGTVSAAGGTIMARTYGDRFGSIFTNADDLPLDNIATATTLPGMFDITVNPNAVLSTRGRWVNDSLVTDGNYLGGAYTSGGSITLNAAPHIALFTDATQSKAVDLSGSIEIKGNSLIDVSGGGYVSSTGALSLNGKGGNVSLIDETVYFQLQQTDVTNTGSLGGQDLFRSDISAFNVSPVAGTGFGSALIPDTINAHVSIADGTIRGFGFKGGGTFKLVTPDLAFGSSGGAGTAIPLDFLQKTGFGTLDLTAWNTALIDNVFSNGRVGKTAIASTEQLKINAGETLNLTQSILPSILTQAQINTVRGLATGTDISREASLAPTNALGDYDNLAAHLKLGGLTELDVLGGGKIIGAPGASITAPKLYNDGTIEISGGTITQSQTLPFIYTGRPAIGVHRVLSGGADLGAGFSAVFGPADSAGKFDELANNALGISAAGNILTNRELVAGYQTDRALYYLGQLDTDQGILFTANSVTNLSGTTILNPRAPLLANGRRIATGRIIDGGTIEALGQQTSETELFSLSDFAAVSYRVGSSTGAYKPKGSRDAFRIDAEAGALIDLSGANGMFDLQTTSAAFTPTQVASNGGLLSALGGGNISGAIVHANGGNRQALGGTIEWLNPVLTQANAKGAIDTLSADQIMSAGFSSFVARGALDTQGAVDLSLGRSFLLMSPDFLGKSAPDAYYQISIASHGDLSIKAPHIGLLSSAPTVGSVPGLLTQAGGSDQLLLQADSIDIAGGVALGASIDHATLDAAGDIRLIGVAPVDRTFVPGSTAAPSLTGGLVVAGDLTLRAAQVYATTGTGNLQQLLEAPTAKPSPFVIASLGGLSLSGLTVGKPGATIRIESNGAPTPSAPLSAGSYLSIVAPNIEQAGVLRAPLGRIDLGSRGGLIVNVGSTPAIVTTNNLTLEDGSVTSVSAKGLTIPYGTTTDLTEYYFSPSVTSPLTREPAAQLSLGGNSIVAGNNATVDLSGGGDLYAYEFVSGTGGSRDVLNRFNSDAFSSTNGYQYTDGRQVYAIVPAASAASVALFDPIYSGDYGALYGSDVGKTVHLDAAPGMPAGEYVLMPAKYALLPGAMRLVENVGSAAPILGSATTLLDGSVLVGGSYGVSGTGYVDSQRRSFTIQNQATIKSYSRIETTSGNTTFSQAGGGSALAARIANDAARLVLDPLTTLHIGASFNTAGTNGGRGSQVDILGNVLSVVSSPSGNPASSGTELAVDDLARLNADSLLIGGTRTELKDGSTDIRVTASSITVANDAAHPLSAPEIILAVDGANSQLNIADGASLVATGSLTDTRTTDYNVASYTLDSNGNPLGVNSGAGAVLRLANGPERLINRAGALAASVTSKPVGFNIGAATLSGTSLALDSSRNLTVDTLSSIGVRNLALSGDNIAFSSRTFGISGLVITPELEQSFSSINHITLRSPKVIGFTPGTHQFNNMFIDAPGLRVLNPTAGQPQQSLAVELNVAGEFKLGNSSGALSCTFSGATNCQSSGNSLVVNANTLRFGSGTFRTYNFDASVALNAASGAYYEGTGVLDVGNAALSLTTPFLVDRGTGKMPTDAKSVQADLTLLTGSSLTIAAPANTAVVAPTTPLAAGARLAFGSLANPIQSVSIASALLRASAGTIDIKAQGDIVLTGNATLSTPSYSQKLGDAADAVTVSANGGTVALLSKTGGIDLGASTAINIGGTSGKAGSVRLIAAEGLVTMAGAINAAAPDAGASFTLDNGLGRFDFSAFANNFGKQFTGNIAIRTGAGDLALNAGQKLKIASLDLTADGGFVRIDGTLDTSGTNGGDIALYARDGVSLGSTSLLDSHSSGYADTDTRQASAGDITLGVGASGSIAVAQGAVLDLGTRRLGDRLVAREQTDPITHNRITAYTFIEADKGGRLLLRAPVITQAGADTVNVDFAGSATGARDVTIEGYRSYDLASVAADPGFTGVTVASGTATIDVGATNAGKLNFFADKGAGTLVDFIQNFDISAANSRLGSLTSLANFHKKAGVELTYSGDIVLASNWNLGAGSITNIAAAVADGDMKLSPLGPYANGAPRYEVVPGREAHLFQNHVNMLYRTGGTVDGESGILTLRAGGNLNLQHSITDGFFAFSDQTDPDYISYQLGGGQRSYQPSINIICGKNDCGNVIDFALDTQGKANLPPRATSIDITLSRISAGQETFLIDGAPYSAAANAAAPTGLQTGGAGDPLGSAQLFPLLADGSAADSFGIRLVGGAGNSGASASANPLHVDAASNGSMILEGETRYSLSASKPTAVYNGDVQLDFGNSGNYLKGNIFQDFALQSGIDPVSLASKTTHVQFGNASSAAVQFLRQEALAYFANYPGEVQFVTATKNGPVTGFAAPFDRFVQFLLSTDASGQTILQRFGALIGNGSFGYKNPQPRGNGLNPTANTVYVRSLVRTGTGSIDVAAAADVDLRNGANPVNRNPNGGNLAAAGGLLTQAGGTAIYTAGHIVNPALTQARLAGTSTMLSIDPTAYLPSADIRDTLWVPDNSGRLQTNPVFATGGGSISAHALNDVLGRRDVWSESLLNPASGTVTIGGTDHSLTGLDMVGTGDQRWRTGDMGSKGLATTIRVNAQQFSSGLGTLGGGDISVSAGNDARELTIALDTTVATGDVGTSFGSMVFGGGNLDVKVGHDIAGGRFDISTGTAALDAGGDIGSSGLMTLIPQKAPLSTTQVENLPELRLTDTAVSLKAGGSIALGRITALGTNGTENAGTAQPVVDENALGYYTGNSAVVAQSPGDFSIAGGPVIAQAPSNTIKVLPATLDVTSFSGNIDLGVQDNFLYPSVTGQLSLLAAGTLKSGAIDLDDGDPSLLPGIFSANSLDNNGNLIFGRRFTLPVTLPNTSDTERRLYHNLAITHANDKTPARIAVGGDLTDLTLFLSKQGRISAGRDIINMVFTGQNLAATDVTRIVAGRDITATTTRTTSSSNFAPDRSLVQGNMFALGGPGALFLEAGRNMGPFLNSATIANVSFENGEPKPNPGTADYPGGIFAVGNDYNPWLAPKSADLYAFFGVGPGMNFTALRETYINPANSAALDGDLFEQNVDVFGNKTPDRSRPIYSPILIAWMQQNQADVLVNTFGTTDVTATQAYTAFAALPDLVQRRFLLDKVYFNELAAPSRPDGNSYLQYIRGYRAVETLFPAALGYTANDLSGAANGGTRVKTGNLDLRLAAIETTRDSNITILGPGGDAILGSVVRTSVQAAGRAYQPQVYGLINSGIRPTASNLNFQVLSIPIGYEGVLSLRGGAINGFTDGDLRLNQSRLFTQQSGDITLWSSNGDLNAGQGPKSAANVPPIILRFNPNGGSEVDSASGVVGAGIAGFEGIRRLDPATGQFVLVDVLNDSDVAAARAELDRMFKDNKNLPPDTQIVVNGKIYRLDRPAVTLVAPVGTIDAGDAGVRASGDIFVAAAHVANADNFKVGGTAVGVPSLTATRAPVAPASAASAAVANMFRGNDNSSADQRSRITVDVLGVYNFNDQCVDDQGNPKDDCKAQ